MKDAHPDEAADQVVERFLAFLAQDKSKLVDVPAALHNRIATLTNGMIVDLDAEIDGDVAIYQAVLVVYRQHSGPIAAHVHEIIVRGPRRGHDQDRERPQAGRVCDFSKRRAHDF
jgi:hypothetical protein